MDKKEFLKRARAKSWEKGDYWDNVASMVSKKFGVQIEYRKYYTAAEWNWMTQAKEKLYQPGD